MATSKSENEQNDLEQKESDKKYIKEFVKGENAESLKAEIEKCNKRLKDLSSRHYATDKKKKELLKKLEIVKTENAKKANELLAKASTSDVADHISLSMVANILNSGSDDPYSELRAYLNSLK